MLNLVEIRRQLHQIPEIGLQEFKTQSFLLKIIHEIIDGKDYIELKTWRTGF